MNKRKIQKSAVTFNNSLEVFACDGPEILISNLFIPGSSLVLGEGQDRLDRPVRIEECTKI